MTKLKLEKEYRTHGEDKLILKEKVRIRRLVAFFFQESETKWWLTLRCPANRQGIMRMIKFIEHEFMDNEREEITKGSPQTIIEKLKSEL